MTIVESILWLSSVVGYLIIESECDLYARPTLSQFWSTKIHPTTFLERLKIR